MDADLSEPARLNPEAFLPGAAGLDGLQFFVESLLGEVHGVGDAGHRFEADEIR